MGLDTALTAIGENMAAILDAAGLPSSGIVFKGWPTSTEIVKVLGQVNVNHVISLYPLPARNITRWLDKSYRYVQPDVTLDGVINTNTLAFSGTAPAAGKPNFNVHAFIVGVNADVYAPVVVGDSLAAIATKVANAVNALALPGITAAPSGAGAVLTGAAWKNVNIGGTGSYERESSRVGRQLQATIWTTGASDPNDIDKSLRYAILDAIVAGCGTQDEHFITDSTGEPIYLLYHGDTPDDNSESSYSLYVAHVFFDMEYSMRTVQPATQVGVIENTLQVNQYAPTTKFIGGPTP